MPLLFITFWRKNKSPKNNKTKPYPQNKQTHSPQKKTKKVVTREKRWLRYIFVLKISQFLEEQNMEIPFFNEQSPIPMLILLMAIKLCLALKKSIGTCLLKRNLF